MIFRSTFHISTPRGLEAHPGRVLISDDQVLFCADGETTWHPIMCLSGLNDESRETIINAFREGEIKALQDDIRGEVHRLNDAMKQQGSSERAVLDYDDQGEIVSVSMIKLRTAL